MRTPTVLLAVLLSAWAADVHAQAFHPAPVRFAPLVHVRILGPEGMHVTFFQGNARPGGFDFAAPVVAGLRPGYLHRVRLSNLPDRPGMMLSPTIEVTDALCLPPHLSTAKYPVPVTFSEQDLDRIAAGRFITKVVYLEDPEKAVAVPTRADQPLELDLPPNRDLMFEAHQLGRPMVVVRVGSRDVSDKELAAQTVPETVLLPGQNGLGTPPVPPCLPWAGVRLFDPTLGPKPPTEECLHDGGDAGLPAGVDHTGQLRGVEPADTVAEYRDASGRLKVAVSNRVCLCVPRFGILRTEVPLQGFEVTQPLQGAQL